MPTDRMPVRTALLVGAAVTAVAWLWMAQLAPRSGFYSVDLYFLFYPAHFRFGEELARGHLPVWNPDLGLGINELADSQFGFLYPPNLLFALLPTALAIDVLAWLHFALAATATYLLCVACGLSAASAAVAAVAVVSGRTLHALGGWTTMLATFAWCPAAFLAARRLGDAPGLARASVLAVVLALQLLAGYLQFSLYTVALLPLFLWPAPAAGDRRTAVAARALGWTALAAVVALGLAAVGVLPALDAVAGSVRDRANIPEWFYELTPVRIADYPRGLAAPELDARLPAYAGIVVPLLAAGAIVARGATDRLRVPALVLTCASLVLSLGKQTPIYPLLWKLPVGHLLTHPHKWVFFFSLGVALLAAVGTEAVRRAPTPAERIAWLVLGVALLALVPFATLLRVAGAILLALLLFVPARARAALVVALPLVAVVATLPAYRLRAQRPSDNLNYFARYDDAYRWLAGRQDAGRTFVLTPDLTGSPRQGEIARVAQVTTNGTFLTDRLDRFMKATRAAAAASDVTGTTVLLRAAGARFVLTGRDKLGWLADAGLERVFTGQNADVWEDVRALPRAYLARRAHVVPADEVLVTLADPTIVDARAVVLESEDGPLASGARNDAPGTARIVASTPDLVRVAVEAPAPAVLVLLDAWSHEWQASIDGADVPTRNANGVARAVEVPAGTHEVAFRFVPRALHVGAALSAASAAALLAALLLVRRRRA